MAESTELSSPSHGTGWILVRGDGALGSARRIAARLREIPADESRPVIITPGPRWVPQPDMEQTLSSVLRADPDLAGVAGWWRWADARPAGGPASDSSSGSQSSPVGPATVRVGHRTGDDLSPVDLLVRPMSVGPIAVRAGVLPLLGRVDDVPADAVLDAALTWFFAAALVGAGVRVGSIPRTCSTRTRTVAEDPEMLRPIGLAWLTQIALGRIGHDELEIGERRELLARWRAAPVLTSVPGGSP